MVSTEPDPERDGRESTTGSPADQGAAPTEYPPPGIDASVPSVARVYDALLGGKDNFAVDRAVARS